MNGRDKSTPLQTKLSLWRKDDDWRTPKTTRTRMGYWGHLNALWKWFQFWCGSSQNLCSHSKTNSRPGKAKSLAEIWWWYRLSMWCWYSNCRFTKTRMSKNKNLLKSFTEFCEAHPDQRFWQALRNWSGATFIFYSTDYHREEHGLDTFYWENKTGPGYDEWVTLFEWIWIYILISEISWASLSWMR